MEILIVRHGQSQADIEDRMEGRADFPLTDLGKCQAQKLAKWIAGNYKIDMIISSPLKRAAATAQAIGSETGLGIIYDENLMEWNNGLLAGLLRKEADEKFPLPQGGRRPHHEFAESESFINFRARAEMFLSRFLSDYDNKGIERVCIVSHGGMINMLFRSFIKLPMDTESSIATGDTGVHLWRIDKNKRHIIFLNKQEHLMP